MTVLTVSYTPSDINSGPGERQFANIGTVYTCEGTLDIHSLVLGEDLTGIAAFE